MIALLALAAALSAPQRAPDGEHPEVPQGRVDAAIGKGVAWLRNAPSPGAKSGGKAVQDCDELILLTLVTAGVPGSDPKVESLLQAVLAKPLLRTYQVSLLAMCLEEIDRVKHRPRIARCAQFLLDNMSEHGRWSYGQPSPHADALTATSAAISTDGGSRRSGKPAAAGTIPVRQMRDVGSHESDNSNSQYAALGMRACHDAGIVFPKDLVARALKSWIDTQHPVDTEGDGGAPRRVALERPGRGTAVAAAVPPRGWCYTAGTTSCSYGDAAYGSMTAGAVGAVCIYRYMLGQDWKRDPAVLTGMAWLDKHWTVQENPKAACFAKDGPDFMLHYYLYAVERIGLLYYTTTIGTRDWYKDGALFLLDSQGADGSWTLADPFNAKLEKATWSTCFAILFLKKATRPMVASTAR